uniref:Nucleoside diphosphate kinase Nm23-SD6 n=1 Tax=Suberites domuncula TaxID=55567 RepID=Q5DIX0_SUBDO|nr:nucleoside diphosphate kinase Nm23-SD6 [Suberites domuncula]
MSASHKLQLTFAILKPDLMLRPLAAHTVRTLMIREGLWIVRSALLRWETEDAQKFYAEHEGKFFYDRLVSYMTSGPINPMILAHPNAVETWRKMMGPTKSYVAQATAPDSIRGQFGLSDTRNSTHGADSDASAQREMQILFPDFDPEEWHRNEEEEFRNGTVKYCKLKHQHVLDTNQSHRDAETDSGLHVVFSSRHQLKTLE